jgi:hypothetical protein
MSFMEMRRILYEKWRKKLVGILKRHESNPKNLGPRDLGEVVIVIAITTTTWQLLLSRKVSQKLALRLCKKGKLVPKDC